MRHHAHLPGESRYPIVQFLHDPAAVWRVVSLIGIVPTVPLLLGLLLLGGLGSAAFHPAGTSLARTAGAGISVWQSEGMLMGFATGTAAVLYIAIGSLQERIGLAPAMRVSYLALIPAALVAFYVLSKYRTPTAEATRAVGAGMVCACVQCACTPNAYHDTPPAASPEAHQHRLKG